MKTYIIIYLRDSTNCWDTWIGIPYTKTEAEEIVVRQSGKYPSWKFQIVEITE
jgi:hypothetical protein